MFKYTTHTLKKIESLFKEASYSVRYGKGNFKAGYAVLADKNVIVVNRFFDTETRINSLLDILTQVELAEEKLTDTSLNFLEQLIKLRKK